jgi:hypothetical protein
VQLWLRGLIGVDGIGFALLLGGLLALLALSAFPNMGQVFQPNQTVVMAPDDAFGHDMTGI